MDWNMLYTNGDAPSLKQNVGYDIDNPLWAEFDSRIRSAYRIGAYIWITAAVPCSQAGNIKYKKSWEISLYLLPNAGLFYRSCGDREAMNLWRQNY